MSGERNKPMSAERFSAHLAVSLVALVLTPAATARAEPVERTCPARAAVEARKLYEVLDLAGVLAATAGLEACADGSAAELAEALRWRAQVLVSQGKNDAAVDAFALLETISPGYALDPLRSPKLHELHLAGRARVAAEKPVFARLAAPTTELAGRRLRADVFDPSARALVVVFLVQAGAGSREVVARKAYGARYEAAAPDDAAGPYRAQVNDAGQVVFLTPNGRLPAGDAPVARASPAAPPGLDSETEPDLGGELREPDRKPGGSVRTGLLVAGGAAAVVAVAVITAIAIAPKPPVGTLGRIELP